MAAYDKDPHRWVIRWHNVKQWLYKLAGRRPIWIHSVGWASAIRDDRTVHYHYRVNDVDCPNWESAMDCLHATTLYHIYKGRRWTSKSN